MNSNSSGRLMPDTGGNIDVIHSSLKATLGGGRSSESLDDDIAAASKRILLHNIEFQSASAPYSIQRDSLRAKYISLNPSQKDPGDDNNPKTPSQKNNLVMTEVGEGLPSPRVVLYPEDNVKMEWTTAKTRIGAGLVNMGNTCFFNSILQCLTYTAPLVNYLNTSDHRQKCRKKNFCMMCEVQAHIRTSLECTGRSLKPHSMLQKLRCIAKHMKWGRQEDAHEFLRFLVDHMQQSCLNGETKLDRFSKDTTVINQIFGGYLRSQVTCSKCQGKSNTFDPFMDLSLDLKGVNSAEDALQKFVKPEFLENENAYKCPKCKMKVRAMKRFTIQKAPNVLTIQLNRFDFSRLLSGKINKFIRYPEKIDLRKYMSQKQGDPVLYHLYGVTVHSGYSSDHGHYYSYVKSPSKSWYCMNDSSVHQVNTNAVLNAEAYVLFYARANKPSCRTAQTAPNNSNAKNVSPIKGPYSCSLVSGHLKPEKSEVNGMRGKPSSELGTPIKRQPASTPSFTFSPLSNAPKIVPHGTSPSALPGASKISFPILTPQQKKQQLQQQQEQQQKEDGKRIVLQIKHGNSTTMEKSPDGKSKVVNNENGKNTLVQSRLAGLVPYNDDSDSEQENNAHRAHTYVMNEPPNKSSKVSKSPVSTSTSMKTLDINSYQTSIRSIPLPSSSGDANCDNVKNGHTKKKVPSVHGSLSSAQRRDASSSPHQNNLTNGIRLTPQHDNSCQKDSTSSSTPQRLQLSKVNAQGDAISSLEKPAGKGGVVALELPPVVTVSSPSSAGASAKQIKATSGKWLVHPQDSAPSPRGSCSSTNSVNSTTEWTVESKGSLSNGYRSKQTKSDVDPGKVHRPFNSLPNSSDSKKTLYTAFNSLKQASKDENLVKYRKSLFKNDHEEHIKLSLKNDTTPKKTDNSLLSTDITRTPVCVSDTKSLLSPSGSQTDENGLKKSKKHKKKQKNKEKELLNKTNEAIGEDSSSRSDSSSKKKKKHKHKKTKLDKLKKKLRKDSSSSDSDSSYGKRHKFTKHKKSKHDSDTDSSSSYKGDRSKRKSDPSDEYEWVEKTIDSPAVKQNITSKSKASVQTWNHHIKDDLAPKRNEDQTKHTINWDGTRVPKIANHFFGSSQTLGNAVLCWDGSKNHVDQDIEKERLDKKRQWSEDYNEELDSGKVKKIKKLKEDDGFGSYNPFQQYNSKFGDPDSREQGFPSHHVQQHSNKKFPPSQHWSQAAHSKHSRFQPYNKTF